MVRYLASAILVRLADEGARVALVLLALQRTEDPLVAGLLVACLMLPHVLAAPAMGWALDRTGRPRLILASSAVVFGITLAATAVALGRIPLPVVLLILLLGGSAGPALTGGLTSQLASLVSIGRLPRAYGADSMTYNVSGIVGPALVAAVAGLTGPEAATLVLACLALCGGGALAFLPSQSRAPQARLPISSGIRTIVTRPILRTVTLASSFAQLGIGALAITTAVIATSAAAPAATGWMLTSLAAGGLAGSLWWTWRPSSLRRAPGIAMLALIGVGAPLAAAALTTSSLVATSVLYFISGVFLGPATGALFTTRHVEATPETESQVFTLTAGLKITFAAVGVMLGGVIAGLAPATQLILIAACTAASGLGGASALWLHAHADAIEKVREKE